MMDCRFSSVFFRMRDFLAGAASARRNESVCHRARGPAIGGTGRLARRSARSGGQAKPFSRGAMARAAWVKRPGCGKRAGSTILPRCVRCLRRTAAGIAGFRSARRGPAGSHVPTGCRSRAHAGSAPPHPVRCQGAADAGREPCHHAAQAGHGLVPQAHGVVNRRRRVRQVAGLPKHERHDMPLRRGLQAPRQLGGQLGVQPPQRPRMRPIAREVVADIQGP